jgi:hypothetical protein
MSKFEQGQINVAQLEAEEINKNLDILVAHINKYCKDMLPGGDINAIELIKLVKSEKDEDRKYISDLLNKSCGFHFNPFKDLINRLQLGGTRVSPSRGSIILNDVKGGKYVSFS